MKIIIHPDGERAGKIAARASRLASKYNADVAVVEQLGNFSVDLQGDAFAVLVEDTPGWRFKTPEGKQFGRRFGEVRNGLDDDPKTFAVQGPDHPALQLALQVDNRTAIVASVDDDMSIVRQAHALLAAATKREPAYKG